MSSEMSRFRDSDSRFTNNRLNLTEPNTNTFDSFPYFL